MKIETYIIYKHLVCFFLNQITDSSLKLNYSFNALIIRAS